ncbi:MAG: PQQ-binding-like beta-propeller repeat protein [Prolixibacteraceae bacterium]
MISLSAVLLAVLLIPDFSSAQKNAENYWPQWRGPSSTGVARYGNPPVEFNETKNLKWKTSIPGKGHATPIVWGDKIIIQTAVPTEEKINRESDNSETEERSWMRGEKTDRVHDFKVILVNRENGGIIWEKTVISERPLESTHELGSWASNSPATDGERIYAYFGSRGVYCLDFDGKIIWQKDFGQMEKHMSFGEGSSPYLYNDKIFIQWDHEGESFIAALNKKTGKEEWKVLRDEKTSWSSPLVVEINGRTQVITSATTQIRSYDYHTGDVIWTSTGLTRNVIPNPVYADSILYVMSGFRGSALQAIDLSKANGDISGTVAILWTYNQETPYTPQPVFMDGKLYFLRVNNGFLTCLDAKTGEPLYTKEKLPEISTLFSSPAGAEDKLYIAAKNICVVVKAGENFEVLSTNELDDNFHASPVIVGNDLILRGFNSLYCFSR